MDSHQTAFRMMNSAASEASQPHEDGRRKILVVDDNKIILRTLKAKLEAGGYMVLTADDGSTAVSTVRREKPDLVILDIYFPPDVGHGGGVPWDGFLILNWLRRMEEAVNIPVIIITGQGSSADRERYLAAGVAGFFYKPINPEELLTAIEGILGSDGRQAI
jgi:CheY-like chemotaxis protein